MTSEVGKIPEKSHACALEYSCSVWHPHKKSNKDKIEKVQRRAARFVSNNFRRKASVSEMLHDLGWQSLDGRRQDQRLVLFSKLLTDSRRLKRRTSSRQPTPVQGRITASNSNTSRQIVIHIGRLAPMWQQSGTLLFCSCHGIAGFPYKKQDYF